MAREANYEWAIEALLGIYDEARKEIVEEWGNGETQVVKKADFKAAIDAVKTAVEYHYKLHPDLEGDGFDWSMVKGVTSPEDYRQELERREQLVKAKESKNEN